MELKPHPGIIIHCSDSPQGRGDNAATIDRWHKERGWSGIGYHYVILEDGTVEEGRDINKRGAHARGYNSYIGVCLIGKDEFTEAQYNALEYLVLGLMEQFDIPVTKVLGHYDVSSKTCPNFNVKSFMRKHILG